MRRVLGLCLAGLVALAGAAQARADIVGFKIDKIEGVGSLDGLIDDRLSDDHMISFADCLVYMGGEPKPNPDGQDVVEPASADVVHQDVHGQDGTGDSPDGKADDIGTAEHARILIHRSLSSTYSGYDYAIKIGTCSDTAGISDEESTSCWYVKSKTALEKYSGNETMVELSEMIPEGCVEGDTGDISLYFFIQYADDVNSKLVETVEFKWDFEAPATPTDIAVEPGEGNLKVSWTDDANASDTEYKLYWSEKEFTDEEKENDSVSSKSGISVKSFQIDGLEVGKAYYVAVAAVDDFENESAISDPVAETPVAVDDFWEHYKKSGGQEEGGYCFIATAAFGSPLAPAVVILRRFRDTVLLTNPWGRALVYFYYEHSPGAARAIRERAALRAAVRVMLLPVVALAWLVVETSAAGKAALLLLAAMAAFALNYRKRLFAWRRS